MVGKEPYYPFASKFVFDSIQEVLSVGYILLIITGMMMDYVEYALFGINIFAYADILDFLLSPFKRPNILIPVIIVFILSYIRKKVLVKKASPEEIEEMRKSEPRFSLYWEIMMIFSLSIGFTIGTLIAYKTKVAKQLEAGKVNTTIELVNGEKQDIYLLGKNNTYLFYFNNQDSDVQIMPISGNVKIIIPRK